MPGFLILDGQAHEVWLTPKRASVESDAVVAVDGDHYWIHLEGRTYEFVWEDAISHFDHAANTEGDNDARAPMPGLVVALQVAEGVAVEDGEALLVIESMKLETVIKAPRSGVVEKIHVVLGQTFERDALLVSLRVEAE